MDSGNDRVFPARLSALSDLVAFGQRFCDAHAIGRSPALRLRLVLEELFTNTVRHGHGGDSDAPVHIALALLEGYVTVEYEDDAPHYDPLSRMTTLASGEVAPLDGPPSEGLGSYLVGKSLYGARYAYEEGRNRLWLALPGADAAAPPTGQSRER